MPMCNANENDPLKNVFNIVGIRYALVPVFDPTRDTGGGARARAPLSAAAPETDPRARRCQRATPTGQRERGAAKSRGKVRQFSSVQLGKT